MTNNTGRFHSLSRRIVIIFCMFTLALSLVFSSIAFILMYTLEDSFIEKTIVQEAEYLSQVYQSTGQWPSTRQGNMQLYFSKESFPEDIRQTSIAEPRRKEFYGHNNRHYHLHTLTEQPNTFLVAEVSADLLVRPIRGEIIKFLLMSTLIVTISACLIAWLMGRRTTRPLKQLAQLVNGVAPENIPEKFAHHYPNNEIGILATTLERTLKNMSNALEREKCFTRDTSHELRTPLAIIKNAVEVYMCKATLNNQDKQVLNRINEACQQMEQTVSTLLILAREENTQVTQEATKLMPMIEASVINNHYILANKPVEVEIDNSCNITITCQPGMLKVLINNLISNAFQYTEHGKVSILFMDNQIIVKDTGPGIEAEISNKITEPAIKGSQSTGFGFGLSIVKRLCDHQGWLLVVTSDQGTTVSVTLS